ncbi:hypothetical protein L228DRAFT_248133 [Xylona heveae TC161]|uniref:N-acetylglucosamine-induced protein 1 n=1 Tax=Xylona heveae (strain CBS 132557 / TC161) TaxID=1328760 RepID=A0A165GPQ7_XYLHT|nr:hypothetical protein L228DRAFT_248133 [Xylona heveae TC161]KZF22444.1 hypothetical protein L228DRAFT_248133 [Xylona heveae TC161]
MTVEDLPFWLVNVPRDQWPATCPDFLINANPKDQRILSTPDQEYHRLTWAEVQDIVKSNQIGLFQRAPSDLRKYLAYSAKLKKEYGAVVNFVLKERLQWADLIPKGPPFTNPDDIKILYNDWPYGIDKRIVHLVVWTKFELNEDPTTGDLTSEARQEIEDYVQKTFCSQVDPRNVIWFKNWRSLKSVHAIEHFHVMLFDADPVFLRRITNGDVPLSEKVGSAVVPGDG